jgi:hypothetical protein
VARPSVSAGGGNVSCPDFGWPLSPKAEDSKGSKAGFALVRRWLLAPRYRFGPFPDQAYRALAWRRLDSPALPRLQIIEIHPIRARRQRQAWEILHPHPIDARENGSIRADPLDLCLIDRGQSMLQIRIERGESVCPFAKERPTRSLHYKRSREDTCLRRWCSVIRLCVKYCFASPFCPSR